MYIITLCALSIHFCPQKITMIPVDPEPDCFAKANITEKNKIKLDILKQFSSDLVLLLYIFIEEKAPWKVPVLLGWTSVIWVCLDPERHRIKDQSGFSHYSWHLFSRRHSSQAVRRAFLSSSWTKTVLKTVRALHATKLWVS